MNNPNKNEEGRMIETTKTPRDLKEQEKCKFIGPVIKVIVFMCIFGVILYYLCDIFEYKNNYMAQRYKLYKELEPDTVDVVLVGTSGIDRSWIAAKGFEKFGLTAYTLSMDALPCWITLDVVKEAYKYQNPKLIVLDMRMYTKDDPSKAVELSKTRSRRPIDTLDFFSINRLDAINRTQKVIHEADPEESRFDLSYFFSFIQYHSMWADEGFKPLSEIGSKPSKYMGFYMSKKSIRTTAWKESAWTEERQELPEVTLYYLEELLNYCEEHDIELLFVDTPHQLKSEHMKRTNELCRILDEKGINWVRYSDKEWFYKDGSVEDRISGNDDGTYTVNYNGLTLTFDKRESAVDYLIQHSFDRSRDFYDESHLNFGGAVIFTRLFGDYLVNNYDLEDHTEDESCSAWKGVYTKIKNRIKKYQDAANPADSTNLSESDYQEIMQEELWIDDEDEVKSQ